MSVLRARQGITVAFGQGLRRGVATQYRTMQRREGVDARGRQGATTRRSRRDTVVP